MKQPVIYDEKALVEMLGQGSNTGFVHLYDHYGGALLGVINGIVGDRDIAGDILQDVFVNIFGKIGSYDGTKFRLYTWMAAIARNLSTDLVRSKGYRNSLKNVDELPAANIPSQDTSLKTDHIGLRGMCMKLAPRYQEVIELTYFQGWANEETALMLGVPLGTVKTRIRSGLLQLRAMMQERQ